MAVAGAQGQVVLVSDDDHVQLATGDKGKLTAAVVLINNGPTEVDVTARLAGNNPDGCEVDGERKLEGYRQGTLGLVFIGCPADRNMRLVIVAAQQKFVIVTDAPDGSVPDLSVLLAFLVAFALAIVVMLAAYAPWRLAKNTSRPRTWTMTLPGLAATWTFKDSWAANATVITAAFTGLFGTEELSTALLGDHATAVLATALVAAAISVGLAGLSPMVVQVFRRWTPKDGEIPAGLHVTPAGLVLGGMVTFAATSGQLAVIVILLIKAEFAPAWIILFVGGLAGVLLVVYAITSTVQNLRVGSVPPEAEKTTTTTGEAATVRTTVAGAPRHAAIF